MSYFNDDQRNWLNYLASLPDDLKCECGWDLLGACCRAECQLSREQIQAELDRLGLDVRPAVERVRAALARRQEAANG